MWLLLVRTPWLSMIMCIMLVAELATHSANGMPAFERVSQTDHRLSSQFEEQSAPSEAMLPSSESTSAPSESTSAPSESMLTPPICHILAHTLDAGSCARLASAWRDFRVSALAGDHTEPLKYGRVSPLDDGPEAEAVFMAAQDLWIAVLCRFARGTNEMGSRHASLQNLLMGPHMIAHTVQDQSSEAGIPLLPTIAQVLQAMDSAVTAVARLERQLFCKSDIEACAKLMREHVPGLELEEVVCIGSSLEARWKKLRGIVLRELAAPLPGIAHYRHIMRIQKDIRCMRAFTVRLLDATFGPLDLQTRIHRMDLLSPRMKKRRRLFSFFILYRRAFGAYVQWNKMPRRPDCAAIDDWIVSTRRSQDVEACPHGIYNDMTRVLNQFALVKSVRRRIILIQSWSMIAILAVVIPFYEQLIASGATFTIASLMSMTMYLGMASFIFIVATGFEQMILLPDHHHHHHLGHLDHEFGDAMADA